MKTLLRLLFPLFITSTSFARPESLACRIAFLSESGLTYPSALDSLAPKGTMSIITEREYGILERKAYAKHGDNTVAAKKELQRHLDSFGRGLLRENQASEILASLGYEVIRNPDQLPELREHYNELKRRDGLLPKRRPDLILEKKIFDIYSPETRRLGVIAKRVHKKSYSDQSRRIVINLFDIYSHPLNVDLGDLADILVQVDSGLIEVLVLTGTISSPRVVRIFPLGGHFSANSQ